MFNARITRRGVTLVEILVVVAIMAVLIGLLLSAIQRVRQAAAVTYNKNSLRQMILAIHQIADQKESSIDKLMKSNMPFAPFTTDGSLFVRMLPYVHGPISPYRQDMTPDEKREYMSPSVKIYQNPYDPSIGDPLHGAIDKISYALNMCGFDGSVNLASSIRDGTSQTIAFADKYHEHKSTGPYDAEYRHRYTYGFNPRAGEVYGMRRPTFADKGWEDVLPVTDPKTLTTRASVPGKTFQTAPRVEEVEQHVLSTPFRAGLTVALFDGSVRTVAPGVSESAFWLMVTPAAGDNVSVE